MLFASRVASCGRVATKCISLNSTNLVLFQDRADSMRELCRGRRWIVFFFHIIVQHVRFFDPMPHTKTTVTSVLNIWLWSSNNCDAFHRYRSLWCFCPTFDKPPLGYKFSSVYMIQDFMHYIGWRAGSCSLEPALRHRVAFLQIFMHYIDEFGSWNFP
jgi:hypothetical protein